MQKVLQAGGYTVAGKVEVRARIFLYNIFEIGVLESLAEPLPFLEDMVDILLCGMTQQTL
jgi:hypothetical protein